MKKNKTLYWLPRILAILYILFISMFALDAFGEGYNIIKAAVAFLIHLIPSFILLAVLWVAWSREKLGGILFMIIGISYILLAWGKADPLAYAIMTGPLFLIGLMFIFNGFLKNK